MKAFKCDHCKGYFSASPAATISITWQGIQGVTRDLCMTCEMQFIKWFDQF